MGASIVTRQISKQFGGVRVLDGITLEVEAGTVHSLIGPNGAGKSTFANILCGYVPADSGEVTINGVLCGRMKPAYRARAGLGRTFQNLELFSGLSVLENVQMGCYLSGANSALGGILRGPRIRRIAADDRRQALQILEKLGLYEVRNSPVGSLPFGLAKLVELARLMALRPTAIVLDEPAAGLPTDSAWAMEQRIRELADGGAAVLLIEHNMTLVMRLSDTVTVLHRGELLTSGPPESVRANPEVLEAYLGTGARKLGR